MGTDLLRIDEGQIAAVRAEIAPVLSAAKDIVVLDEVTHLRALNLAAECKQRQRKVEEVWGEAKEATHKAWKTVTDTIASFTKPLADAASICNQKAYAWKKVEDERRRIEAQRIERENAKRVEEELLRTAEALTEDGNSELADEVMAQKVEVATVKPVEVAKPEGISYRENWQFRIVDASIVPREYLMPDEKKIGQFVKANKANTKIAGVEVYDAGTTVIRR